LPLIDESTRQEIQSFHKSHKEANGGKLLSSPSSAAATTSSQSDTSSSLSSAYFQEISFLEDCISKRAARLSSVSSHLNCKHLTSSTLASSATATSSTSRRGRTTGGKATKNSIEDSQTSLIEEESKQCAYLKPQVDVLSLAYSLMAPYISHTHTHTYCPIHAFALCVQDKKKRYPFI
jgi:hypothetical protein